MKGRIVLLFGLAFLGAGCIWPIVGLLVKPRVETPPIDPGLGNKVEMTAAKPAPSTVKTAEASPSAVLSPSPAGTASNNNNGTIEMVEVGVPAQEPAQNDKDSKFDAKAEHFEETRLTVTRTVTLTLPDGRSATYALDVPVLFRKGSIYLHGESLSELNGVESGLEWVLERSRKLRSDAEALRQRACRLINQSVPAQVLRPGTISISSD